VAYLTLGGPALPAFCPDARPRSATMLGRDAQLLTRVALICTVNGTSIAWKASRGDDEIP
jgi:hypothetical protein